MPYIAVDAYAAGLSVPTVLAFRFGIASLAIFGFLALRRQLRRPTRRLLVVGSAIGLTYSAVSYSYFESVRYIPPALATLLQYLYPAFVALASGVLARRAPSRTVVLALVLSVLGIGLAAAPGQLTLGPQAPVGIAFGVVTSLLYAGYVMVSGRVGSDLPSWEVTAVMSSVCCVVLTATGAVTGQLQVPQAGAWLPVILVSLVCTVLAIGTFLAGVALVGPIRASIISTIEPVANLGIGVAFYSFVLSPGQPIGAVMVLVGATLAILGGRRAT